MKRDSEKTYTFRLKGRKTAAVIVCAVVCVIAAVTSFLLIATRNYLAFAVPVGWVFLGILFLRLGKEHHTDFITVSPEGVTLSGAKKKENNSWVDTKQEDHFVWNQIQKMEFTRYLGLNPDCLYFELSDGSRYQFDLKYFGNSHQIIDVLRKHIHCCRSASLSCSMA